MRTSSINPQRPQRRGAPRTHDRFETLRAWLRYIRPLVTDGFANCATFRQETLSRLRTTLVETSTRQYPPEYNYLNTINWRPSAVVVRLARNFLGKLVGFGLVSLRAASTSPETLGPVPSKRSASSH